MRLISTAITFSYFLIDFDRLYEAVLMGYRTEIMRQCFTIAVNHSDTENENSAL